MADSSVIAACMTRYDAIKAAFGSPPIFFDEAPQSFGGVQLRPPYVVLRDGGLVPSFEFEFAALETSALTFEVYAEELAGVDAIAEGIKFGGGAVAARAGFDFGSLPSLAPGRTGVRLVRTRESRFLAGRSLAGAYVHGCRLEYAVTLQRTA